MNDGRMLSCFTLAVAIFAALLCIPLPFNDVSYIQDPELHVGVRRAIYWGLGIAAFIWLNWKTKFEAINLMALVFGPVVFMYIGLYWLSLKIFPRKVATTQ